ncbi:hypothetical protein [Shinella sp.]|jgi:hypothetical protein|uniref:hypothetical protein n=1 Tax=Shinella sp. TaxID=1870904 RepID=UPI003F6F32CF
MAEAKLAYRPLPHDDWGFIRTEEGAVFATVRRPLDEDEAAAHRAAGTDPFEPLALALIQAVHAEGEPDPEHTCITCLQPLEEHDPAYYSEDGIMHALCCGPERESFYNADERPLVEGEPIPRPFFWSANPKRGMPSVDDRTNDRLCVDRFAMAMRNKLNDAGEKGRRGWDNPDECSEADLSRMLREHVEKGDPVDVANFAMMLHQRGLRILPAVPLEEIGPAADLVAFAKLCLEAARQGGSLEGIEIQEAAFKFGLLEEAPFDPALHFDPDGCAKAGDAWFDYSRAYRFAALELGVLRDLRPFIGRRMTRALINDMAAALEAHAVGQPAPAPTNTETEEIPMEQAFSGWAIVELMGHRTRPGRVKEVEMAGSKMLQVDIPVSGEDFVTEFYGAPALYSIRPCTEEIAREKANYSYLDPRPVRPLDYRPQEAIEVERHRGHEEDGETGPAY